MVLGCLHLQVVQKLTQMVGKNVKLYDMVLQFLRTLFLRTRNVHYCTLRAELLMSLHDLDISDICSVDPCHKVLSHFPLTSPSLLLGDELVLVPDLITQLSTVFPPAPLLASEPEPAVLYHSFLPAIFLCPSLGRP